MTGYLDKSKATDPFKVSFDYTHFLCESSREHLSFLGALQDVFARYMPRKEGDINGRFPSEVFCSSVTRSLSSLYSDVSNLITLINEAKRQQIQILTVYLPYTLDDKELEMIRRKTGVSIEQYSSDREYLQILL